MSERDRGKLVPFTVSSARLRRSAQEHRRQGRPLEALELTRQAARQEDTPRGYLVLAQTLEELACFEQALAVLYPLCAYPDMPIEGWLVMGRCQAALGQREAALDSLYHYLEQDPYSAAADAARDQAEAVEDELIGQDDHRLAGLMRRGLSAWRSGDTALGERRLRRAMHLTDRPARMETTLALLFMASNDAEKAIRETARALRHEPVSPRAWTILSVALNMAGRRRAALGVMNKAERCCRSPEDQEIYLSAAAALNVPQFTRDFLLRQLRRMPCRAALMHPLADCLWQLGEREQAEKWWHRILRLDPEDMRAMTLLRWASEHPDEPLPPMGTLPREELRARVTTLAQALAEGMPMEQALQKGSELRMLMDWCFTLADERLQRALLHVLTHAEEPVAQDYLRSLLTRPAVLPDVREEALRSLAVPETEEPLRMIIGSRIITAKVMPTRLRQRELRQSFLRRLLVDARALGQAQPLTFFADKVWQQLTPMEREMTAMEDDTDWIDAVKLMYLRAQGENDIANAMARSLGGDRRRVCRLIRRLQGRLPIGTDGGASFPQA